MQETRPDSVLDHAQGVVAEAYVELPGAKVRPPDAISQPVLINEPTGFVWSIAVPDTAARSGTAWLFLVFDAGADGRQSRLPLSAQSLHLEGMTLLGLDGPAARLGGSVGLLCAFALALPGLDKMLRGLHGRRQR